MVSNNPVLTKLKSHSGEDLTAESASYSGVALKALYFIIVTLVAAFVTAYLLFTNSSAAMILLIISIPAALICAFVSSFVPSTTPVTGSIYAAAQGVLTGAISAIVETAYSGIVFMALVVTFGTFGIMMILYAAKIIKVTQKFRSFMFTVLIGIAVMQLLLFVISLFVPSLYSLLYGANSWLALLISVGMVLYVSFFVLIDLDNINSIVAGGLDKKYEWMGAFSLVVTLIWLYTEVLRLLVLLFGRRN